MDLQISTTLRAEYWPGKNSEPIRIKRNIFDVVLNLPLLTKLAGAKEFPL
jgi:hypothetical protein